MKSNKELLDCFEKFIDALSDDSDATLDDFYNYAKIPRKYRSDFASVALINGYNIRKQQKQENKDA